jgi:hypothetical protein
VKYRHDDNFNYDKNRKKQWRQEHDAGGFRCSHCKRWVVINTYMGTKNRNHCNLCLWSKHVDESKGDRRSECGSGMKPVGLTFKHEGIGRQGELMLVHNCMGCDRVSINRLAADDNEQLVLICFETSLTGGFESDGIRLLEESDRREIRVQLFGHA